MSNPTEAVPFSKRLDQKYLDRIISKIDQGSENECWEFTGYKDEFGYGQMRITEDGWAYNVKAHRLAYYAFTGINPGIKQVLHKCDVPQCCNPNHLFLGSQRDNMVDMKNKGRARVSLGEMNPNRKLDEKDVKRIRSMQTSGMTIHDIAPMFDVTIECIRHVMHRRTWKHI